MTNIIPFPKIIKKSRQEHESSFRDIYAEAGLSQEQINSAIEELMPHIDDLIREPIKCEFTIPGSLGLTQEQREAILEIARCSLQSVLDEHNKTFEIALIKIVGIVGKRHRKEHAI